MIRVMDKKTRTVQPYAGTVWPFEDELRDGPSRCATFRSPGAICAHPFPPFELYVSDFEANTIRKVYTGTIPESDRGMELHNLLYFSEELDEGRDNGGDNAKTFINAVMSGKLPPPMQERLHNEKKQLQRCLRKTAKNWIDDQEKRWDEMEDFERRIKIREIQEAEATEDIDSDGNVVVKYYSPTYRRRVKKAGGRLGMAQSAWGTGNGGLVDDDQGVEHM